MTTEIDQILDNLKSVCERIAGGSYGDLDDLFEMTSAPSLALFQAQRTNADEFARRY